MLEAALATSEGVGFKFGGRLNGFEQHSIVALRA
jgi:hypothetical protein